MRKSASQAAAVVLGCYVLSLGYVFVLSRQRNVPQHADALVVLGALVHLDNTPSATLYNRSTEAARLYKLGAADYIITTGGVGLGKVPEADVAAKILYEQGIPANKILSERESHSTYQNLAGVAAIAGKYKIKSLIVVSDQPHVPRGVLVAKVFDFSPVYWDYPTFSSYASPREIAGEYLREAAAMLAYAPRLLVKKVLNL